MHKSEPNHTAAIIQKRQSALRLRSDYQNLFVRIVLLTVSAWFFFTHLFLLMQMDGNAMFPALKDGDLLFAFRLQQHYAKGDVLIYTVDGKTYVGRLAACETDAVILDSSGTLLVNGTPQKGDILYPTYAKENLTYPHRVPAHHFFLLGDYRTHANDSRDFGSIPKENIKGKVITILRRRGL